MSTYNKNLINAAKIAVPPVVLMVAVHFYHFLTAKNLSYLGIYPREVDGLLGIITTPFVHGDWSHLISNILPFFMLTMLIAVFYQRIALMSTLLIYLLTGLMVWLFARPVYHIGASGVVYGLVAFVFWTGVFKRNVKSIVLALAVLVMYSGYFFGIVPFKDGVSWESHLFGALVGIVIAYVFKGTIELDEVQKANPWADEQYDEDQYFLQRDAFSKTKAERIAEAEALAWERENNFLSE